MATQSQLSIIEAVETLSSIADLEFDRDIGVAQKHEVILGDEKVSYKTVHWLHKEDAQSTDNDKKHNQNQLLYKQEAGLSQYSPTLKDEFLFVLFF